MVFWEELIFSPVDWWIVWSSFKELDIFIRLIRDLGIGSWGFEVECIQDDISDELCTSDFERASVVRQVFDMWIWNFD